MTKSLYSQLFCRVTLSLIAVYSVGCGPTRPQNGRVILTEGLGIAGTYELGHLMSKQVTTFGPMEKRIIAAEGELLREIEFFFPEANLTIDALDRGNGEMIARISILCTNQSGGASQKHELVFHSQAGLNLSGATRKDIIAHYGAPNHNYETFTYPSVVDAIRNGIPYSVKSPAAQTEYIHYPALGIAFVLEIRTPHANHSTGGAKEFRRRDSFSATNASQIEAKLAYI